MKHTPVYNAKGNITAMCQVPENLPPAHILVDILKGKLARCMTSCKNLQVALKDNESETDFFGAESEKDTDEEGNHSAVD